MNLFLDTVSPENALIFFDEKRQIISKYFFDVRQNESTLLINEVDNFLKNNNLDYKDLENIVVVNWPWSFTWIRTTILFVNTINFVTWKNITWINYFELFKNYPIIKTSSKRDSFFKESENKEIENITNEELEKRLENTETIYWDALFLTWKEIISKPDYEEIIKNIKLEKNKKIDAFYLKKPSIT